LKRRTRSKKESKNGSKDKPQYFILPNLERLSEIKAELAGRKKVSAKELPEVLIGYANRGYLACMLDEGRVYVARSKKTGKPLSAKIIFEKSRPDIVRVFAFILQYFDVNGEITPKDYSQTPRHKLALETGVSKGNEQPTHILTISDPSDVRELCRRALPFSERSELLCDAIDACNRKLGKG